jgi:hypothetical protein
MDVETPPWGRDETEMDRCLALEKKRTFHQRHPDRA